MKQQLPAIKRMPSAEELPVPVMLSELQDRRLTDRDAVLSIIRRLGFAEEQIVGAIARAYEQAHEQYFADMGFTRPMKPMIEYEAVARGLVESAPFRFWIGVLAGHDTEFLQEALG